MSPSDRTNAFLAEHYPEGLGRFGPVRPIMDELESTELGIKLGPMHYDRDGQPITMREHVALREHREYVVVEQTEVGPYWVSTVWLGLDHNFMRLPGVPHVPIIFETMVFSMEVSYAKARETAWGSLPEYTFHESHEQERYPTEELAREGHERICKQVEAVWAATRDLDPRLLAPEDDD